MDNIIENKTNIIIGTTSLNRPMLHNQIFPDWISWLNNIDKQKYTITWFINIDIIKKLNTTHEETTNNYLRLIDNSITVYFLKCEDGIGNFLKACKRLAINIKNFADNNGNNNNTKIIWLEDDWKLNINSIIDINELLNMYSGNLTNVNLTFIRSNYIHALAPCIISYNLWKNLHYKAWTQQMTNIDPEHCVGIYYLKHFGKYSDMNNLTVINKKITQNYLNQQFINEINSYYTYNNIIENKLIENNSKFIKKEDIITKFNNVITFIRISPTVCIDGCDYGRKFMEEYELEKNRGAYSEKFYNHE